MSEIEIKIDPKYVPFAMMISEPLAYTTYISPRDLEVRTACGVVDFLRGFNQVWKQIFEAEDVVNFNTNLYHHSITDIACALLISKGWYVSRKMGASGEWDGFILVSPSPIPQPKVEVSKNEPSG